MNQQSTRNTPTQKVLFVCTANMYRSRLAGILFNHYASQTGLNWEAESRALGDTRHLSGMTSAVGEYLTSLGLEQLAEEPRDPIMLTVDELERARWVIALCRDEHRPMLHQRYASVAKKLEEDGILNFWNIYDSRCRLPWYLRIPGLSSAVGTQPEESGAEHVHFAVKALVYELAGGIEFALTDQGSGNETPQA